MATFDAHKNLAYSTVLTAPSPASSGVSLVVQSGDGAKFPAVPFNAPVWPAGVQPTTANSEIVRVTNISTDTLTITRNTNTETVNQSRSIIVGDQIGANITAKTLTDIETLFPTGTVVGTTDTQTVSAKTVSDTFMGKVFDTRVTKRDTTLEASTDYLVDDTLENSASFVFEVPATSTIEVTPIVKQAETQSYFGIYDFVESGCSWTADAAASTLLATMTDGYVWINGRRLRVNAIRSHTFTASKDTYVDFSDNGDGTVKVTYTETANNAAAGSPTLVGVRNAIIISGATNIAAATSINQGQETIVLPIVSSIPYAVTDSLGNLICPRDPSRRVIGYRQSVAAQATITAEADLTALSSPVIVPSGRKIKISAQVNFTDGTVDAYSQMNIKEGSTVLQGASANSRSGAVFESLTPAVITSPSAGSHTYKLSGIGSGGTSATTSSATTPGYILVELV